MKYIYKKSALYEGCENIIYYVEDSSNKKERKYMHKNLDRLVASLNKECRGCYKYSIIGRTMFGSRSLKNLILRNEPTIGKEELKRKIAEFRKNETQLSDRRLLCVTNITRFANREPSAEILVCAPLNAYNTEEVTTEFFTELCDSFNTKRERLFKSQPASEPPSTIRYKLGDIEPGYIHSYNDNYEYSSPEELKLNPEIIATEILSDSIHTKKEVEISPIVIDEKYNIILPLYPQINIKLEPLPKSVYLLFLQHPEGIILKDISNYEEELKEIYTTISGRQNITVINRLIKKVCNPGNNILHKSLSIIRKTFCNKMRIDIAQIYIPTSGRSTVHKVPIMHNKESLVTLYRM